MFTLNNPTTHEAEASLSKLSKAGLEHLTRRSILFIKRKNCIFMVRYFFVSVIMNISISNLT
jgi:hypothetical protein